MAASSAAVAGIDSVVAALLSAPEPAARLAAIATLRQDPYRGPKAFQGLAAAMGKDLSSAVRRDAAIALLDYQGTQSLAELEKFLAQEQGEEVRRDVCVALATAALHLSDPGATSLLTTRLSEDEAPVVRRAAIQGLAARLDVGGLGELKRAAQKDADPRVRAAAAAAYQRISHRPKAKTDKPKAPERAPYDAVKGKDPCPRGSGWCECSRPPLRTKPHCVPRADCEHTFFNSYQTQGFSCTWDGQAIE